MSENPSRKAVVTGATSGIGAATVRALCADGITVLAIARRTDRLAELSEETGCHTAAIDVRETGQIRDELTAFDPDIIVNNAGVGHGIAGLAGLEPDEIARAIETNLIAPIQITAAALHGMKQRGNGHIVNIGSIAGLHAGVSALYGAGKTAIHRFSQNLRNELGGTGIRVTEICPGRVSTEFYDQAVGEKERLATMKQTGIVELQPEDVADAILYSINAPLHVNIATIELLPTEQSVGGVTVLPAIGKSTRTDR